MGVPAGYMPTGARGLLGWSRKAVWLKVGDEMAKIFHSSPTPAGPGAPRSVYSRFHGQWGARGGALPGGRI